MRSALTAGVGRSAGHLLGRVAAPAVLGQYALQAGRMIGDKDYREQTYNEQLAAANQGYGSSALQGVLNPAGALYTVAREGSELSDMMGEAEEREAAQPEMDARQAYGKNQHDKLIAERTRLNPAYSTLPQAQQWQVNAQARQNVGMGAPNPASRSQAQPAQPAQPAAPAPQVRPAAQAPAPAPQVQPAKPVPPPQVHPAVQVPTPPVTPARPIPTPVRPAAGTIKQALHAGIRKARNDTHTDPTPAQASAGNYRHGRVTLHGMDIALENPKGSTRSGVDKTGKAWESPMFADYGYFTGTQAVDGDAVDCFIGPDPASELVVAIDQYDGDKFDETKFVLGTHSRDEAEKLYLKHYPKGWEIGPSTTTTVAQLKAWLKAGKTKRPFEGQRIKVAGILGFR